MTKLCIDIWQTSKIVNHLDFIDQLRETSSLPFSQGVVNALSKYASRDSVRSNKLKGKTSGAGHSVNGPNTMAANQERARLKVFYSPISFPTTT